MTRKSITCKIISVLMKHSLILLLSTVLGVQIIFADENLSTGQTLAYLNLLAGGQVVQQTGEQKAASSERSFTIKSKYLLFPVKNKDAKKRVAVVVYCLC